MQNNKRPIFTAALLLAAGIQIGCTSEPDTRGQESAAEGQALEPADSPAALVKQAAQAHVSEWLNAIPEGAEREFGFLSREEFAQTSLAEPYAVFVVGAGGSLESFGEWRVPVLVRGEYRTLVSVQKTQAGYETIGIGAAEQASELGRAEQATGDAARTARSKSILHARKQGADFVVYGDGAPHARNGATLRMLPLRSAQHAFAERLSRLRPNGAQLRPGANREAASLTMAEFQSLLEE